MIDSNSLSKLKTSYIPEILIIDDEQHIQEIIVNSLNSNDYIVKTASDAISALKIAYKKAPDLVLLDIWLKGSDIDGLSVLERLKTRYQYLPVIVLTSHLNITTAVKSLYLGAYDYIEKPFTTNRLNFIVKRAIESCKLKKENDELKSSFEDYQIIGESSIIKILRNKINKAATTSSRVLIRGPTGAGKEIVARLIHKKSYTNNSQFLPLYLSKSSDDNYLTHIFGCENSNNIFDNSFTQVGIIEQAHNGTLFIDEISKINHTIQFKLLKLLQENIIYREGGKNPIEVNVRIIASTSQKLEHAVKSNMFREDLYNRLNILPIYVPALSEYTSDIPSLCKYFIHNICKKMGLPPATISNDALTVMQSYNWPGNLRQLRNVIEWILIMKPSDKLPITANDLPSYITSDSPIHNNLNHKLISTPLRMARQEFEKQYLKTQLSRFSGNISKTAEFVGMERSALHRKLKILGLCREI